MAAVGSSSRDCQAAVEELARACRRGDEKRVRDILAESGGGAITWRTWGPGNQTSLMWAAREGHLGVVKLLLHEEDGLADRLDVQVRMPVINTAILHAE